MSDRWPALLNKQLAAEYLCFSIRTIERLVADGKLKTCLVRGSKDIRFRRSELDDFVEGLPSGDHSAAVRRRTPGERRSTAQKQPLGAADGSPS
jgi:excisionase family DNA binding protein